MMERITKNNEDQPSIRELNIKVSDVLRLLGQGQTEQQIIGSHPGLQREDFLAVYRYDASQVDAPWDRIRNDIREKLDSVRGPAEPINEERQSTPKN
jgi:uncharacterized protein (DUF433 family)